MSMFKRLGLVAAFLMCGSARAGAYEDFFFALNQDNAAVVADLVQRGFDPNTIDPNGQYGFLLALRLKSLNVAKFLATVPQTEVEVRSAQDESPLMLAALRGYTEICRILIERDADVNKPGWGPLHYAATGGHVEVMRLLIENHAYIDAESPNGSTPLMMAAMYGTVEAVQFLLDAGADVLLKNELGLSAVDFARKGLKPDSAALISARIRKNATGGVW